MSGRYGGRVNLSPATLAGSRNMEHHHPGGEGNCVGVRGNIIYIIYNWSHLYIQCGLQNQTPQGGFLWWSCSRWAAQSRNGVTCTPAVHCPYVGIYPNEQQGCILWVTEWDLTVFCANAPSSSLDYPNIFKCIGYVPESASFDHSIIVMMDFSTHVGNSRETWRHEIGRNGLPHLIWLLCHSQLFYNKHIVQL